MSPGKSKTAKRSLAAIASFSLVAGAAALLASPATAAPTSDLIYGLTAGTSNEQLVTFQANTPGTATATKTISNVGGGDVIGIDVRPATSELYALVKNGNTGQLYTINPSTGVGTLVASVSIALSGTSFGFDFDSTVDRIRIVSDNGQNLRVDPTSGVAINDTALAFAPGDRQATNTPQVVAAGYTNSNAGATSTTLYDIDAKTGSLVRQEPANAGTLNTVGSLGLPSGSTVKEAGLDIAPADNTAYAAVNVTTGTTQDYGFYTVNLSTGALTRLGSFPTGTTMIDDIAVATVFTPAQPTYMVNEGATTTVTINRQGSTTAAATVNYTLTSGTGTAGSDIGPASGSATFAAGRSTADVVLTAAQDDFTEGPETVTFTLSGSSSGGSSVITIKDSSPGTAFGLVPGTAPSFNNNALTVFSVSSPGDQSDVRAITSGVDTNDQLVAIDVRPATGVLYAIAVRQNVVATVNPARTSLYRLPVTGGKGTAVTAVRVGTITPTLTGARFNIGFNPTVDMLRVVGNDGQDLRVNPDTAAATVDGTLAYASGDTNAGKVPAVTAADYTNSVSATPTSTMLYDIDTTQDVLVTQNPANAGTLNTVGPLGIGDVQAEAGLDIAAAGNAAFANLSATTTTTTGATPQPALYRVDLGSGKATSLGNLGVSGSSTNGVGGTTTNTGTSDITDIALASTAASTMPPPNASPSPSASPSASASASPSASGTPSPSASATATATAGTFHPLQPQRILDTRTSPNVKVAAGNDRTVQVTGQGGVPSSGVSSVVLNVTVTLGSQRADLQVYPTGQKPSVRTSNLNFFAGQTVPVQVQLGVGTGGAVNVSVNTGSVHVIVDVFGYYGNSSDTVAGSGYTANQPQRLLDTRTANQPVVAGTDKVVQVTGNAGVPADATAVAFNATLLGTPANADLQIFPTGNRPAQRTSNLNVARGLTKANAVVTALGSGGQVSLSISQNRASVVLDVVGYYSTGSTGRFVPVTPQRIFDTRNAGDSPAVRAGADRSVVVRGQGGVPANATAAVLSVTATGAGAPLDLQVYPIGNRPANRTSTLNLRSGEAVANLAVATLGSNGAIGLSVSQSQAQVILDVVGYFTG